MRKTIKLALPLAALAALTVATPARAATWEPPIVLSDVVAGIENVQLLAGTDGRVLAVWGYRLGNGTSGVEAVSRRPDGAWGPRRSLGTTSALSGEPPVSTGVGSQLIGPAAYGANRWLGLAGEQFGANRLSWWTGTTIGAVHRGGALPETPWETGPVAVFPDGTATLAWTTMRPRRGAGSNQRPRVVVVARGSRRGFGRPHRISPLPPGPPYGNNRGPALSATDVTTAAGGRATVAVAWQRVGRIEARVSRDRGRSYGRILFLGRSAEAFPGLSLAISRSGKVVVAWGARATVGDQRSLVYRVAVVGPGRRVTTRELERTAPLPLSSPVGGDQRGPRVLLGFDGEIPVAAWQTVIDGHSAVRTGRLDGAPMAATFPAADAGDAVLDDLAVAADGSAALAWHTTAPLNAPGFGFVAGAPVGGAFGGAEQVPGAPGAADVRVEYDPQGVLVAWTQRTRTTSAVMAAQLR
jgi:hypothetical protein